MYDLVATNSSSLFMESIYLYYFCQSKNRKERLLIYIKNTFMHDIQTDQFDHRHHHFVIFDFV
jgi:hypothetical protein